MHMNKHCAIIIPAVFAGFTSLTSAQQDPDLPDIGLGWVTVGDPGNPGYDGQVTDPEFGYTLPAPNQGRGVVDYTFRITRSEINSRDMFEFVSTVDYSNPAVHDLIDVGWGVLQQPWGDAGPWRLNPFMPEASRERGQISVTAYQAMAYTNWLHNGRSSDPSTILSGAYDLGRFEDDGSITLTELPRRQPGARFALANLDEYMKAGYYDPNRFGEGAGGWWTYAHQSDEPPVPGLPGQGGEIVLDPTDDQVAFFGVLSASSIPLGVFPETASAYGVIDIMGGNGELTEEYYPRNGFTDILENPSDITSSPNFWDMQAWKYTDVPLNSRANSFRIVALVPTPGGAALALVSAAALSSRRRRTV